ncbi:MAG TPA: 5-methyltetrahydropteroyltriglutamate--homocysteine S-methyltransferase [Steroidobacteraceae bacterium]|nr:5-methyltetrahydropteroyltriglutamate--homocysteine S-methyltransferase [Steroidobacteraceae bacterium]
MNRPAATLARSAPPFRADQVGSLLRPDFLHAAREQFTLGRISPEQLREAEDRAIAQVIRLQEEVGLKAITDGELRRAFFHIDFLEQLAGVRAGAAGVIRQADGTEQLAPPVIRVTDRVRHVVDIQRADFEFLASCLTPGHIGKVSIPSPTMLHFRGGRAGISAEAYPALDPAFYEDVAAAYATELRSLAAAGCHYVQLDDTNLAYLCDDRMRAAVRSRGDDPDELPHRYAAFINRIAAQKPAGMALTIHLCRGNFQSTWAASGGYERVAEALFTEMNVDGYFLEFDDARSGGFEPLRFLPRDKIAVLGLVTTKAGNIETVDALQRRIEQATRFVSLEQLALSPQCGFASTVEGNKITQAQQRAKLELVVQTAMRVWGSL